MICSDRAVIFVGPGLTPQEFREVSQSGVDVRPPIKRGDLLDAMDAGYRTLAIIDGEFYQSLAVSPKEILVALRRGCRVIGGSSMGALRAAEMDVYGMRGVGQIYKWYRQGLVTRDDDVAIMFGQIDDDTYRVTSLPMVNVLWAVHVFKRLDAMSAEARRRMTSAARRIHWAERQWDSVCAAARLIDRDRETVYEWARNPASDLKALDARAVVAETIRSVRQQSIEPEALTTTRYESAGMVIAP